MKMLETPPYIGCKYRTLSPKFFGGGGTTITFDEEAEFVISSAGSKKIIKKMSTKFLSDFDAEILRALFTPVNFHREIIIFS